ncbi:hypothetical protein DFS34DRAFT_614262, partial [Phlyctochytrium arcticum]
MNNLLRTVDAWKLKWYGNDNVTKSGAQDYVLSLLTEDTYPILSYTNKYGRLWGAVSEQDLYTLVKRKSGLYEILVPDRKQKVYFDVDKSQVSLDDVKNQILEVFPNAKMNISGRPGSWHIILQNYFAKDLSGMKPVQMFAKLYSHMGFDAGVYTKNRNFKCINQAKPNAPIQEYIEGSKILSKHLVMHDFDLDAVDIETMEFPFDMPIAEVSTKDGIPVDKFDLLSIPQGNLEKPENFDWLTAEPLHKLAILPCPSRDSPDYLSHNTVWRVMCWCRQVGISFEDFWAWNKQKDSSVSRYKKYLQQWQTSKNYTVKLGIVDTLLKRFYPRITHSQLTENMRKQFILESEYRVEGEN